MNRLYSTMFALALSAGLSAQDIQVRGSVNADDGSALPGVTVRVAGSNTGTVTDANGNFSIKADKRAILRFSFVGYSPVSVAVNGKSFLKISLKDSQTDLSEVVITVPYGTARKSTFTGAATKIDSKAIANSQVASVSKALEGTVAGLQSYSSSGQPGEDATILIRGVGSVNASTTPLYVVDGVPYDGALSSIASSDILSVTVLKDAAAASLYGSRAANGVIMITTKQGQKNARPTINLSAKYGVSGRAVADYKRLSTKDYLELQWEALRNGVLKQKDDAGNALYTADEAAQYASSHLISAIGINPYGTKYPQPIGTDGKLVEGATLLWDDDWEDAMTQNAHYTDVNLSVSGGGERVKYYLSGSYLDNQGLYIESGFKRYTLRANVVSDIRDWLQVGLNVSGTHSKQQYPKQDDSETSNAVNFARMVPSFYPIYQRDPETGAYILDAAGNRKYDFGNYRTTSYAGYNLPASMPYDKHDRNHDGASLRGYVSVTPLKGLSYKMSLNVDYDNYIAHDYYNPEVGKDALSGGSVSKNDVRTTGMTFNNVVNYEHTFADLHEVKLLGGQEYYEYNTSNFGGSRSQVIMNGMYEPDAASSLTAFNGNSDQYKLLSFFGSAEYAFAKRYFLSASVRTDGSSRFTKSNRWGTFWSVGGSWQLYKEQFLKQAADTWLSNLVVRASYGAQGNDNVGYYAWQGLYAIENNVGNNGLHASRLATPELKWETNLNLNVGVDFGLFNNRLTGSVEYFERTSKDLLFSKDLIPSSGFSSIDANLGKVKNYGWEFTLAGTPVQTKEWKWTVSVNATTYKNEILELPADEMWNGKKKWVKGGSLFDYWLPEWAGVNPDNGNPQWYHTVDGERVKTEDYSALTSADYVKAGSSLPDVTGGFQTDLSYRNLSISALFSYALGGYIYNSDKLMLLKTSAEGSGWSEDMLNRWTPENRYTDVPILTDNAQSSWTSSSNHWLVNRSYLRLKTITLSYTLPQQWLSAAGIDGVTVFAQGENLFTLHHQQGLDPEQPYTGTTYYRYPAMRTLSFGINVKL